MTLKDNLEYWNISLNNRENYFEEYYITNEIIIDDTDLINKIHELRKTISNYCSLLNNQGELSKEDREKLIKKIYSLLESTENIEYSEFVAFWKALDISFSNYRKIKNKNKRLEILEHMIEEFCKNREKLYKKLGYSDVTIQTLYDAGSSRKKGKRGIKKLIDILNKISRNEKLQILEISKCEEFDEPNWYFIPDKNKELFKSFKSKFNIKYEFGRSRQNKLPDLIIKIGEIFFIIEAKHIKETGGAQSKQIRELIDFIRQKEENSNVHYVSYLDGTYFNKFIDISKKKQMPSRKKNQILQQMKDIENSLKDFEQNFFVNSFGFEQLLRDLMKDAKNRRL